MNAADLIAEIGSQMNLPSLRLDENGQCRLVFDEKTVVDVEQDEAAGRLHLYSVLGRLPHEGREALYEQLLEANLFGRDTGGAVLAVDLFEDEVLLARTLATERLDFTEFAQIMGSFVDYCEAWSQRLAGGGAAVGSATGAAGDETEPPGEGFLRP